MFGHRNYSGYSFNAKPTEEFLSLNDSVKVNKLKGSQLSVYFNALKHVPSYKQEIIKRNNHFEEFKRICTTKQMAKFVKENKVAKAKKNATVSEILRHYGVRPAGVYYKSALRRAPLKKIKTIGIEVPSSYKAEAIYLPPKKKEVEAYIHIAQPIKKIKPKVQIQEVPEVKEIIEEPEETEEFEVKKELDRSSKSLIEKQLQITREEINEANKQLAQIQRLLNVRNSGLSPVEEEEEVEDKTRLVKQLVDKKCSPIQPRTQWTVKSLDDYKGTKSKKSKLMTTLNSLNQRLQKIQDKYFSEPKIKYRSITDFAPPKPKPIVETLFKSTNYPKVSHSALEYTTTEDESEILSKSPTDYIQELIRRTEKLTKINKPSKNPSHKVKTNDSILVLMPPKQNDPSESINLEQSKQFNKINKGILKNKTSSKEDFDVVLEAPMLQESICKSNYLMKEFNLNSDNKNFDLGTLLLRDRNDSSSSSESLKKNVRFSQSNRKNFSSDEAQLLPGLDIALKNSLFYYDEKDLVK